MHNSELLLMVQQGVQEQEEVRRGCRLPGLLKHGQASGRVPSCFPQPPLPASKLLNTDLSLPVWHVWQHGCNTPPVPQMVEHMRSYEDQLRQEVLLNIERLQARRASWAGNVCLDGTSCPLHSTNDLPPCCLVGQPHQEHYHGHGSPAPLASSG